MTLNCVRHAYLLAINVVTFFVYGIDKAASKRGQSQTRLSYAERKQSRTKSKWKAGHKRWRIPEAALLLLALLGGSFGAWLGMYVWRHKTQHRKFKYGVPLILLVQVAIMSACKSGIDFANIQTDPRLL